MTLEQPLAVRMRPMSLSEIVGQDHLIGDNQILTRIVEAQTITSMILFGPPGTGKTSIAHALAHDLQREFAYFNAGVHTKKELQDIVKHATPSDPVVALIDEIHRLDKPKQDFLLMQLEEGSLIMVGATTENPYISINPAIRSRAHIFELKPVEIASITARMRVALSDKARGLGQYTVEVTDDDLSYIASRTNGDLRTALNTLELVVKSTKPNDDGITIITRQDVDTCLQHSRIDGDKDGDTHYNLLSAFQKSIRGSDVDASLHYLARLIQTGDLISIIRRILVIAYEDISLARPEIGAEALAAVTAAERVGLPEARIPLAQIVVRLALSPKSNVAYTALDRATKELTSGRPLDIPADLKDTHYKGAKRLGRGLNYKYPHDYKYGVIPQQYLPDAFKDDRYLRFRDETDTPDIQRTYQNINQIVKRPTRS